MPLSIRLAWLALGLVGCAGLLAVLKPSLFAIVARQSSQWVDSDKIFAQLDRQVDVDKYVLPYSRALGVAVLIAVALLARLLMW